MGAGSVICQYARRGARTNPARRGWDAISWKIARSQDSHTLRKPMVILGEVIHAPTPAAIPGPETRGWGAGGNVARGLVPRWGRGGAWQNPLCQFAVPSHNSGFSFLGVPAPAGMSDCYESTSRTPIRDVNPPSNQPRHSGEGRNPEGDGDGGMKKCSAGACPPLGSGWGVAELPCPQFAVPNHNSGSSWRAGSMAMVIAEIEACPGLADDRRISDVASNRGCLNGIGRPPAAWNWTVGRIWRNDECTRQAGVMLLDWQFARGGAWQS